MLKLGCIRFRGKCSKHPHFDPHDGRGAIKGGCQTCEKLLDILAFHTRMLAGMREFSPPKNMKKFRPLDDRQMGLFTELELLSMSPPPALSAEGQGIAKG